MNTKKNKVGIVLVILSLVGILLVFIGGLLFNIFNGKEGSYKYKFGDELLEKFDFSDSHSFKGIYKYNSLTKKYEDAFDEYYGYPFYDEDEEYRYLLFFKKNYSKYFFFDTQNNSIVENNESVIDDIFFGHASCSGLCSDIGMCFDFQCEEATDYFELYLYDTCDMYYVSVDGSVIAIEEKKCFSDYKDIKGYDFYDDYYYGNMRVSRVSAKKLGLNDDFKIDNHFNIIHLYDTECCGRYFAISAKTKKVKKIGGYCDC